MDTRARFTRMRDGTAEEFALIHAGETEYASGLPGRVLGAVRSLETGGAPGYAVNRLEHSLQSATRAERDGKPVDYIVAALVHDIGDSLAPYSHGSYAAAVLRPFVSEELCWIVSHHPLFQMYYYGPHMGGDKHARDEFAGHPWFDATVVARSHPAARVYRVRNVRFRDASHGTDRENGEVGQQRGGRCAGTRADRTR